METDAMQSAMLRKYGVLRPLLDERAYRLCAAAEARALGLRPASPPERPP